MSEKSQLSLWIVYNLGIAWLMLDQPTLMRDLDNQPTTVPQGRESQSDGSGGWLSFARIHCLKKFPHEHPSIRLAISFKIGPNLEAIQWNDAAFSFFGPLVRRHSPPASDSPDGGDGGERAGNAQHRADANAKIGRNATDAVAGREFGRCSHGGVDPARLLALFKLKLRMPRRTSVDFMRLMSRLCSATRQSRSRLGRFASSSW
jgi:hypothetical protein